jgi:hypothetical protein
VEAVDVAGAALSPLGLGPILAFGVPVALPKLLAAGLIANPRNRAVRPIQ